MALKNILSKSQENNVENQNDDADRKKDTLKRMLAEIEKLNAQLNAEKEIRTALNDKLIHLSEEIGDLRRAIIEKEKKISEIDVKATKSADLVKEVQPEKLFSELKKEEAKIEALKITIDANKTMMKKIVDDLKEIRNKMKLYRGSEEILKLYSDIKKDIGTLNKLKSRIENDADKVESLFIEIQKKIKDQKALSEDIEELKKLIRDNTKKLNSLEIQLNSKASKQDIRKLINTLSDKPSLLDKILNKNNKEKFIDTNELISAFKEDEEVAKRVDSIEDEIKEYRKTVIDAKQKVDNSYKDIQNLISQNKKERQETNELIKEINQKIEDLLSFKKTAIKEKQDMESRIDSLYGNYGRLESYVKKDIEEIKRKVLDISKQRTAFKDTQYMISDSQNFRSINNKGNNIILRSLKLSSINYKNVLLNIIIYFLVFVMLYNLIIKISSI